MKLLPLASSFARLAALAVSVVLALPGARAADPCIVPDNASGTVYLPPVGCNYLNPTQVHMITSNLPPGTTIELAPIHKDFICRQGGAGCSNNCFAISGCNPAAGETEQFGSTLQFSLKGNGMLAGWTRMITISNVQCQVQSQPRTRFTSPQSFDTVMQQLQGQLPPGDPDFDLLRVTAGNGFGLPSPGHTTLTKRASGDWIVDSFFDITYRIDYIGAPGGHLSGISGSTTATIRMSAAPPVAPPGILTQPANASATCGNTATFSLSVTGAPPFLYQWQKNGASIAGATLATYTTPPVTLADNGCQFRCIVRNLGGSVTSSVAILSVSCIVAGVPESFFHTNNLPPTNGLYISQPFFQLHYANGFIIQHIRHHRFTNSLPPPPPGVLQMHTFDSLVEMDVLTPGGSALHVIAPAAVTVSVQRVGNTGTFQTEMLQLNIQGGGLPAGTMIRESPTLQSTGQTTVRPVAGGYMISSFFDIFTELSLNGGQTWTPAQQPHHVELRVDPMTVPPISTPTTKLPPPNDQYVSPELFHQFYAAGIIIKDVRHKFFTMSQQPPPPGSPPEVHTFSSQVDMMLSLDGGLTFKPIRAEAPVAVRLVHVSGAAPDALIYDTEMLTLDLAIPGDTTHPLGVRMRESPTLQSRGGTSIEAQADGTYRIGSFFDIFTELSLDGGASWSPAISGPAHVELQCNAPEHPFPTPILPPPDGQYISPEKFHALYAQGIIISNVIHRRFLNPNPQPPPGPGQAQIHQFQSELDMLMSRDGGATFSHVTGPASVVVLVVSSMDDPNGTRFFDTEMLSLDMTVPVGPGQLMVRESPSKASLGRTSVRMVGAGGIVWDYISSFFDIFPEVSLDNGQTWLESESGPVTMSLDNTPPDPIRIHCPPDKTVKTSIPGGAVVTYVATATGGCDVVPTITCNPPSGSPFPIGATPVLCTATDSCGQSTKCNFVVTVVQAPPDIFFSTNILPPPNGVYITPALFHQLYANGIIIRDIKHRRFTGGQPPPPPNGQPQIHQFGSVVELEHSTDGGATFHKVAAPANCSVRVTPSAIVPRVVGSLSHYDTEMLQLDISGGTLPAGVMLRESPTLASTGQTTVRPVGGGFMIDSFFDVFTEISLNGGQTWSPALQAAHVELRADPALVASIPAATRLLPPPNDRYISPALFHILAAQGIVIKDVKHSFFTHSMLPPPAGGSQIHQFDSHVDMMLSQDGGQTFHPVRAPAAVTVRVDGLGSPDSGLYDTEMLALDIQGGDLPSAVMIRESPTEPSRGSVSIKTQADGTYRIGSFFDIFPEVTLDGGQTWMPAQGPAHMELVCEAPEHPFPNPGLPPLASQYISPADWHALYAQGIIISNVSHSKFTESTPPPPPGGTQTHTFNSDVNMMISQDGGTTWSHVHAPAAVSVRVTSSQDEGNTRFFETEMLSLNIQGGGLPAGVMVRESPSKQSLGRTSIRMVNDPATGIWDYISSFFDIFTEVSLNGGQTWNEAVTAPGTVSLTPVPFAPFTFNCPSNKTVNATGPGGAVVTYLVTYLFPDCPFGPFVVTCAPPSGSTFPIGTTPVNCTGSDGCGEHPTCSFTVTVNPQVAVPPPEIFFVTNTLPPFHGLYISPVPVQIVYGNAATGITFIRNVRHRLFTRSLPPPQVGGSQVEEFGSMVEFEHSMDGGMTFHKASGPAQVTVRVTSTGGGVGTRSFDTEMLQLNISGGSLPPGVMLRESPTLASTGKTNVRKVAGGYMIDSFFDVFTELSLNGGQTWTPAQQPHRVELRVDPTTIPPILTTTPLLPPPNDLYVSPALFHQLYAAGIIIKDVRHKFFTPSQQPPPPGASQTHQFNSRVDMMVSINGGQTFVPVSASAMTQVRVSNIGSSGQDGVSFYDTEMLQLDLQGGDLAGLGLGGVMVRESPTEPSRGSVNLAAQPDGTYRINSFFDIFTEVSLDGGQSWMQASNGPAHVELQCVAPEHGFPDLNLPPLTGQYISPPRYHALYAQGIVISNVIHRRFTQSQPPPPAGGTNIHSFNSEVSLQISLNSGASFTQILVPNVPVVTRVISTMDSGATRFFDTEMLSLDILGGLPNGIRVRESPTRASQGRTSTRNAPPGLIDAGGPMVSSFFDIFVEVSTDGGNTWLQSQTGPVTMSLALPCGPPPPMSIVRSGSKVTISWLPPTAAYRLQCTDTLGGHGALTSWLDVSGVSPITLDVDATGNRFYRLVCP